MSFEVTGKVIKTFEIESGISKSGKDWSKAQVLIETQDQYPKKILLEDMSGKSGIDQYVEGDMIKVSFNIESNEFNNRYFTSCKAWKSAKHSDPEREQAPPPQPAQQAPQSRPQEHSMPPQFDGSDDLPF